MRPRPARKRDRRAHKSAIDASSQLGSFTNILVCARSRPENPTFRIRAPAEKKCAASPGGTFFILLPGLGLSTRRCRMAISSTSVCSKSGSPLGCMCGRLKFAASGDSKGKAVGSWDLGIANACGGATRYCSVCISRHDISYGGSISSSFLRRTRQVP